jgi:phosphoglycolate phosphatase/putative hydrolase of the HAD superfamily
MTSTTCVSQVLPTKASARFRAAGKPLKALIFDVDGTLYEQGPVRRTMLYRLLRAHITSPMRGVFTLQILRAYRNAQDTLRTTPSDSGDIATEQLLLASRVAGASTESVTACVARWMEQEPLPLLASSIRKEMVELLREAKRLGLRLAVCSDYPADRKLAAMGIAEFFDVVVTAQDPEVQRFKPDPAGLELILRRLDVCKDEAVYVGDRADVDAVAASRAGIRHFILNGTQNLSELSRLLIRRS